jgi:hypothetical protein
MYCVVGGRPDSIGRWMDALATTGRPTPRNPGDAADLGIPQLVRDPIGCRAEGSAPITDSSRGWASSNSLGLGNFITTYYGYDQSAGRGKANAARALLAPETKRPPPGGLLQSVICRLRKRSLAAGPAVHHAEPAEAEQQHRPGGGFGDRQANIVKNIALLVRRS